MGNAATLYKDLEQKRDELAHLFGACKNEAGETLPTAEQAEEIRRRNDELTTCAKAWEAARDLEEIEAGNVKALEVMRTPVRPPLGGGPGTPHAEAAALGHWLGGAKSPGELFVESKGYKSWVEEPGRRTMDVDIPLAGMPLRMAGELSDRAVKATFDTAGGSLTQYDRPPVFVMVEQQRLTVADLLARGETTMNTIRYPREDTYTNAATTVAEGATKPEASWDTSEQDAPVRKIAVIARVTDELFSDFPAMRDYINQRLPFMIRQQEEAQLIGGNGTPPNLTGILTTSGIQTQARGTDTNPDAIYKAIVKVRTVGFFEPDAVVIHPNNWTPVRLLKTLQGEYVWGHPAEPGPERIWGLLVDVTTGITANTGLVGAFKLGAQVFYREGLRLEATNSNQDDFQKNLISIRCEIREALAVYRPLAFASVTSLAT